jgi:Zn-dependent protease with chaperone function
MRMRLYGILAVVGCISAPIYSWPLGVYGVQLLNEHGWPGDLQAYWIVLPVLIWMALVPLLASRAVMRELLRRRVVPERPLEDDRREALKKRGLLSQLSDWEIERLRQVDIDELNAPSIGHTKNVAVTRGALSEQDGFTGALAHELGHQRLHHLHPLALCYLYLWPYFYYDDRLRRRAPQSDRSVVLRVAHGAARLLFTILALPGWLAWTLLRLTWRTAEYDADRFACQSGQRQALQLALERHDRLHQARRPRRWTDRIAKGWERVGQGRALGYLPVPNEHPLPARRLRKLPRWEWSRGLR